MSRRGQQARGRRTGLTLLEVVVSTAILALLTLVIMTAFVPLSNTSNEAAVLLDMDRIAGKVMAQLRRDLRQSGYDDGTPKFGMGTLGTVNGDLTQTATAPSGFSPSSATPFVLQLREDATTWSSAISWRRNGTELERVVNSSAQDMARQVTGIWFHVPTGDQVCQVTLQLSRQDPRDGSTILKTYVDRIEMMNR